MITEVFHKRYPGIFHFYEGVPREITIVLRQGAQIIFQDLEPFVRDIEQLCETAYSKLVRELGHGIYNGRNAAEICFGALCEPYDLWNDAHGSSEHFVKYRFSLLELLMVEVDNEFLQPNNNSGFKLFKKSSHKEEKQPDHRAESLQKAVHELNYRMREARSLSEFERLFFMTE